MISRWPKKKITTRNDSAITVGFWCQAIHKKILQRFDTSCDKKDDDENISQQSITDPGTGKR